MYRRGGARIRHLVNGAGRQRRAFTNGELSPERIARLDEIGFVWNLYDRDWEEMFGQLVAYKERFGDIGELIDWKENAALGKWCSRQRQFFKKGRLSAERIARLEELGFVWDLARDNLGEKIPGTSCLQGALRKLQCDPEEQECDARGVVY